MEGNSLNELNEIVSSPDIQACISIVESIAGYKLSATDKQPFLYFHSYITNPQPKFITKWRTNPSHEKWYQILVDGILRSVQNTMACVLYHQNKLKEIENKVIENIEKYDYRRILDKSVLAIGNTLSWDFEYQAFILAYRRCLDYLTRAISAYFRDGSHSFRKLNKSLRGKAKLVSEPLILIHAKYLLKFEFVLSDGNNKSVRDRISHYEYVPVGTINLSQRGFVLAGGGEQMGANGKVILSEIIETHVIDLKSCIREMINSFVDAMRANEINL